MSVRSAGPLISKFRNRQFARKRARHSSTMSSLSAERYAVTNLGPPGRLADMLAHGSVFWKEEEPDSRLLEHLSLTRTKNGTPATVSYAQQHQGYRHRAALGQPSVSATEYQLMFLSRKLLLKPHHTLPLASDEVKARYLHLCLLCFK